MILCKSFEGLQEILWEVIMGYYAIWITGNLVGSYYGISFGNMVAM